MVVNFQTPRLKRTLEDLARQANLELLDAQDGGVIARPAAAFARAGFLSPNWTR